MNCKGLFLTISVLFLNLAVLIAAPNPDAGKTIFKNNCASCHNKNMKDDLTGPALGGVEERWAAYPKADLYSWIKNSQSMVTKGHPMATQLFSKWKSVMTPFPSLSDEDVDNVLAYIDGVAKGTYGAAPKDAAAAGASTGGAQAKRASGAWIYYGIFGLLAVLALFLWNIMADLSYSKALADGNTTAKKKTFWQLASSKAVVTFVLFALILFGGYTTVNNAIALGRSQNYSPEQPIKFSHATHAGLNKIDCNYCHDGARRSKQSVIPGTSTCMNCHKAITKGSNYGTAEITKIYASIGFDPTTGKYIENYDKLSNEEIEKIYKKWIGDSWMKDNSKSSLTEDGQHEVDHQWNGIVNSLTNENKASVSGPIEWIRLHNLPDHVYFNHSQHVTVGKLECQQCHGKVETMDVVKQYSPLSMGWCINCHRETDVKFKDNKYYESYKTYHEELKSGKKTSVKVSDIGGLECQKCHY